MTLEDVRYHCNVHKSVASACVIAMSYNIIAWDLRLRCYAIIHTLNAYMTLPTIPDIPGLSWICVECS